MGKTMIKIGPADHGRPMSLAEFEHARVQEGYLYELSRGVITVADVPKGRHAMQLIAIRRQLTVDDFLHPGRIVGILGSGECQLLIDDLESERHPDVASYLSPPSDIDSKNLWRECIPEIVVEIVSPSSRKRDYEGKPEEYRQVGAKEYWIFDDRDKVMVAMRRVRNRWVETRIEPPAVYRTRLLPGLEFSCGDVFRAAGLI
jgi:Uma2 family endonuclease